MKYAIIENGTVKNIVIADADFAESQNWILAGDAAIGDIWDGENFITPDPVVVVPSVVDALQGLLALEQEGYAEAYTQWASSPERTFTQRAFIDKALRWRRDDQTLQEGADALGITPQQLDGLFIIASKIVVP